jgi:predicted regulator of Ras-like GTPase activity (Roadblock/LC7/MglB family)
MAGIEETLRTLRDVQGVYGSFVVSANGALVARDLPTIFDGELFAEVGPRVTRLYETFLSGGEELDSCMLRFAEHKVYLRKMAWGVIGVLSTVAVNMPALRMVSNLVIRKIDPEVAPSRNSSFPPPAIGSVTTSGALAPYAAIAPSVAPPAIAASPSVPPPAAVPPSVPPPASGTQSASALLARTASSATGRISRPPERFIPPPPVPPLAEEAPAAPRQVRMYRGRPVTD